MKNACLLLLSFLLSFSSFAVVGPILGQTSACAGSAISLSDTTAGGTWSSSNTSVATVGITTGIVTGISAGSTTIKYTVSGVYVTASFYVNPLPNAYPITGGGSYCSGGAGIREGLLSSNTGISYTLYRNGVPVATVAGTYVGIDFGTYWLSGVYTVQAVDMATVCTSTMSGTDTISVISPPTIYTITGGGSICTGGLGANIGLSGSNTGVTYQLFFGAFAVGSPVTGTGLPFNFGTYTVPGTFDVQATDVVTGCSSSMTRGATITVLSSPSLITGNSGVCVGTATNLSDSMAGGTWSSSNTAIASIGAGTGSLSGILPGTSNIMYSLGSGCTAAKTVTVYNSSQPITGTFSNCPGLTMSLSDILGGGTWSCGNTSIATIGISTGVVSAIAAGTSTITYTSTGTCGTITNTVTVKPYSIMSHATINAPDTFCNGPDFYISTCGISSTLNVTTWFGDGTSNNTSLTTGSTSSHADIFHVYEQPGTYSVKQVLYNGTIPQDSVVFSSEYLYCRTLPIKFFYDANNNYVFDSGDAYNLLPVVTEIDSNGIPVDTISSTTGFYHKVTGLPGTVYSFRVLSAPGNMITSCPTSGIIYDTLSSSTKCNTLSQFTSGGTPGRKLTKNPKLRAAYDSKIYSS